MKFTKIRLKSDVVLDLPISDVKHSDPYILKSATGLGPPEIDVFMSKPRNGKGYYQGRSVRGREPSFLIGLNPDYKLGISVSNLRETLYAFLSPGESDAIELIIVDDQEELMSTTAYFQKLETNPFSTEPIVQLVLSCPDSYFKAFEDIHVDITPGLATEITNRGTAETGFIFEVAFQQNTSPFWIRNQRQHTMSFLYDFMLNDILRVNTNEGSRSVFVERRGVVYNIAHTLSPESKWLKLHNNLNTLSLSSSAAKITDLYYVPAFWGV